MLQPLHHGEQGAQGLSAFQLSLGTAAVLALVALVAVLAWVYARRRFHGDRFK